MNSTKRNITVVTPIGPLAIVGTDAAVHEIHFRAGGDDRPSGAVAEAVAQLRAYFAGELQEFDLPLEPQGTDFQRAVWTRLRAIPYGETTTYGAIAHAIGRPDAVRAVGAANGANPLPVVVPCHRVIGKSGSLTGFGGGLDTKRWLLDHEARVAKRRLF